MACDDADTVSAALVSTAAGPRRAKTDAGEAEAQPIADLIAAEKYIRSKCASAKPHFGLRFTQLKPPGAV